MGADMQVVVIPFDLKKIDDQIMTNMRNEVIEQQRDKLKIKAKNYREKDFVN